MTRRNIEMGTNEVQAEQFAWADAWATHMTRRGLAVSTIDVRHHLVTRIERDAGRPACALTADELEAWLADQPNVNEGGRRVYLFHVQAFARWAHGRGYVERVHASDLIRGPEPAPTRFEGSDLTATYLAWLGRQGRAESTIKVVSTLLRAIERDTGRAACLLSDVELHGWLEARPRSLAPGTRRQYLTHVKGMANYFIGTGMIDANPVDGLGIPRQPAGVPRPMPLSDVARALTHPDAKARAMVALAVLAGLRCVEIARLQWEHVGESELLVHRGKGNGRRRVPTHPALWQALGDYLSTCPAEAWDRASGHVFPLTVGERSGLDHVTAATVSDTIRRALIHQDVVGSAHRLRHTFATEVYRSSGDLLMTQRLLGHAKVATTQTYADVDMGEASVTVVDAFSGMVDGDAVRAVERHLRTAERLLEQAADAVEVAAAIVSEHQDEGRHTVGPMDGPPRWGDWLRLDVVSDVRDLAGAVGGLGSDYRTEHLADV